MLKKQQGNILLTDELAKQILCMARVIAVGPGKLVADTNEYLKMQSKPGDMVFINPYLGNKIRCPHDVELVVQYDDGTEYVLQPGGEYILQNEDTVYATLT